MRQPLRFALVTPRYHEKVVGGAELHGRWLAEHLAERGHRVDVFTTCALDGETWANALRPGTEHGGPRLSVNRFRVDRTDRVLRIELDRKLRTGARVPWRDEERWLRNGVFSSALEATLAQRRGDFDAVLALPYLVGTTYSAFRAVADRFWLIPCLHDEVYARLAFTRQMLTGAAGLLFNTEPERELARRIEPDLAPSAIVGLGWDPAGPGAPEEFRARYGVEGDFIVYVGRFESDKNVPALIESFTRYRERRRRQLTLVMVGGGSLTPPPRDDVRVIDLDWADRDAMLRAARALVQPSVKESLSIVIMQAWLCGLPVLVDARGEVPRDQCRRANGGLWYGSYLEFEAMLDRLLDDPQLAATLGRQGRAYVETELSWPRVLERLEDAVDERLRVAAGS